MEFWLHVQRCKLNIILLSHYHLHTCLDHELTQLYTPWHNLQHHLFDGIFWLHVRRCKLNIVMQKTKYGCSSLFPPNCIGFKCKGKQVQSSHEVFQSILMEGSAMHSAFKGISVPTVHHLSAGTHFLIWTRWPHLFLDFYRAGLIVPLFWWLLKGR